MATNLDPATKPRKFLCIILQALLDEAGINSFELSKRTDLPYSSINKMLNKPYYSPTLETLKTIANYFDVSIEQLIGDQPIEKLKHIQNGNMPATTTNPKFDKPCNYKLLIECVKTLEDYTIKNNKAFNLDKSFRIIKSIYQFAFMKNLDVPDKDFAMWFLENI